MHITFKYLFQKAYYEKKNASCSVPGKALPKSSIMTHLFLLKNNFYKLSGN